MRGAIAVRWRMDKVLLICLFAAFVVGMIIGASVVFNPRFNVIQIGNNILDGNILRVVRPNVSLGSIVITRIFSFTLVFVIMYVASLHRWASWVVFVVLAYKGFEMFINLYWALSRFGAITGVILFIVYLFIMLVLLVIVIAAAVWCLRTCATARSSGLRGAFTKNELVAACTKFIIIIACFGLFEWFLYWLILSNLVFVF